MNDDKVECEFCEEKCNEDEMNHDYMIGRKFYSVCFDCVTEQQLRGE